MFRNLKYCSSPFSFVSVNKNNCFKLEVELNNRRSSWIEILAACFTFDNLLLKGRPFLEIGVFFSIYVKAEFSKQLLQHIVLHCRILSFECLRKQFFDDSREHQTDKKFENDKPLHMHFIPLHSWLSNFPPPLVLI